MNAATLKFFADPHILRQIGRPLLTKFFERFTHLLPSKYFLPNPRPDNEAYFDSLAEVLARTSELPDGLAQALFEVEALAVAEDRDLDSQTTEAIPLSRAIQSWLRAAPNQKLSLTSTGGEGGPALQSLGNGGGEEAHQEPDTLSETPATEVSSHRSTELPHSALCTPHSKSPPTETLANGVSAFSHPLPFLITEPEPWPDPVDGKSLLAELVRVLNLFIILPKWAAETLALWILHTYAFQLRDVTTYIGLESPEKRCGKTTLLSLLNELANRAVASSNISPPAFFRVIEDLSPTLLIDEVDTFLNGNDQLRGILNSGYKRKTAFVLRAVQSPLSNEDPDAETSSVPGAVKRYSCWCPKAMARIGHFPDTLADRCIIIQMHRKTTREQCARLRDLEALTLRRKCARFVLDHQNEIATASPSLPAGLNDRAADIWEPLLALADIAGGEWPELARQAAIGLTASAQESSPIASLLFDICLVFVIAQSDRMFSRTLAQDLNSKFTDRPWAELRKGKEITGAWLAQQLRPYGIRPRTLWIGDDQAKGYHREDFTEAFQRYLPKAEAQAYLAELTKPVTESSSPALPPADPPSAPRPKNNEPTAL